jgi:hypothetical protein
VFVNATCDFDGFHVLGDRSTASKLSYFLNDRLNDESLQHDWLQDDRGMRNRGSARKQRGRPLSLQAPRFLAKRDRRGKSQKEKSWTKEPTGGVGRTNGGELSGRRETCDGELLWPKNLVPNLTHC